MKLGFYYHQPFIYQDGLIKTDSCVGVFIDSFDNYVDKIMIFGHSSNSLTNLENCNYLISSEKAVFFDLGEKTPAWHRYIFGRRILRKIPKNIDFCDLFLIRGPTPLFHHLDNFFSKNSKIAYLLVGEYFNGFNKNSLRSIISSFLDFMIDSKTLNSIKKNLTLVNSQYLFNKYQNIATNIHQIRTTTLLEKDLKFRKDSFKYEFDEINILYSGRFDLTKGLLEIVDAAKLLISDELRVKFHFVGWEEDPAKPIENIIKSEVEKAGIGSFFIFHGKKAVGKELFNMYSSSQIFVNPSYSESFPRTIWEAYAQCTPVIASTVGSIPSITNHEKNIIHINPKNGEDLYFAIKKLIQDEKLRKKIILGGWELVQSITLERQSKIMFTTIMHYLDD
jgi:glycosyltransferase involved in cell wall biosynthesis